MNNLLDTAQQGVEQTKLIVEWVTGLTGLSSFVVVWMMIQTASAIVRALAKVVLVVGILLCAVWAYLHFGLDAYFDILPILGLG